MRYRIGEIVYFEFDGEGGRYGAVGSIVDSERSAEGRDYWIDAGSPDGAKFVPEADIRVAYSGKILLSPDS